MLCAADVILGEIREEAELKREACNAVILEADGRDLHNAVFAAGVDHLAHELLHLVVFGCGVIGLNEGIAVQYADSADDAGFMACGLQNGAHHERGGRFALGARNADDVHLLRGVAEELGAQTCEGKAGVIR